MARMREKFHAPDTRLSRAPRRLRRVRHALPRARDQKTDANARCGGQEKLQEKMQQQQDQQEPQQEPQQLSITLGELQAVGGFLLAARGAILIERGDAAITALDTAQSMLDRVAGQQQPAPAVVAPAAVAPPPLQQPQLPQRPKRLRVTSTSGVQAAVNWARPDKEERTRLLAASTTTAPDAAEHDHGAQLAFVVSLAREVYLAARPEAPWDDDNPSFLVDSPLKGFHTLFVRVELEGLRDGEVVLERRTGGHVSGLAMYAAAGRRGETMLQLLGFGSRAGLGEHLHGELLRHVRRRHAPPITLRLSVANCISTLAWFYLKHHWKGDDSPGGQLTLTLEKEEEAPTSTSAVATAAPSRAVDYLVLALAEGPLERDALIEAAQALGSKNKHLGVYLGQQKREADGFITQYLGRYELTRKGREQVTALGGPIVVVQEG